MFSLAQKLVHWIIDDRIVSGKLMRMPISGIFFQPFIYFPVLKTNHLYVRHLVKVHLNPYLVSPHCVCF